MADLCGNAGNTFLPAVARYFTCFLVDFSPGRAKNQREKKEKVPLGDFTIAPAPLQKAVGVMIVVWYVVEEPKADPKSGKETELWT